MGDGGSVFQWNPEERISFAFVPFDYCTVDLVCKGGKSLQVALMKCIKGELNQTESSDTTC